MTEIIPFPSCHQSSAGKKIPQRNRDYKTLRNISSIYIDLSLNRSELNTVLESHNQAIVKLQRRFRLRGVPEDIGSVEPNEGQLHLLYCKLLPNARSWADSKGYVRVQVPFLLFVTVRVEPLRPKHVWLRELFGVFGKNSQCKPNPCALQDRTTFLTFLNFLCFNRS